MGKEKEVQQFWWKQPDGTMKLVDVADFHKAMDSVPNRSNGYSPPPPGPKLPGLGDAVAKATTAAGVKPCGGCKKRQEAMNKATPGWLRRVLGKII